MAVFLLGGLAAAWGVMTWLQRDDRASPPTVAVAATQPVVAQDEVKKDTPRQPVEARRGPEPRPGTEERTPEPRPAEKERTPEPRPQPEGRTPEPPGAEPARRMLEPLPPLEALPDDPPGAVVPLFFAQVASLDRLIEDARELAAGFGKKSVFEDILQKARKLVSTEGASGFDSGKPWSAYVRVSDRGDMATVVLLLPMRKEASFRRLLQDIGLQELSQTGDLTAYRLPREAVTQAIGPGKVQLPEQVYVRFADDYAHICLVGDPNLLTGTRLLPAAGLFAPRRGKLLSATLRIDRLPPPWRERLLAGAKDIDKLIPPSDQAIVRTYATAFAAKLTEYTTNLINGGRNLTLDVALNPRSDNLALDLYLQGRKDSPLAAGLAELSKTPSLFGDLALEDAVLSLFVNVRFPRELRLMLPLLVSEATRLTLRDATEEDRRKHEPMFRVVGETFAAGELDAGMILRSRGEGNPASVLAGVKVPNGEALNRLFRDLVGELDKGARDLFELDAVDLGGVKAHRFRVQEQFTDSFRKVHGDNPVYYAFRKDALLATSGAEGKQTLVRAIALKSRPSPLALVTLNFRELILLLPVLGEDAPLARQQLTAEHPGRMRFELAGGDALRLHIGMELAALRFMIASMDKLPLRIETRPR
jgi:hypothetical protein